MSSLTKVTIDDIEGKKVKLKIERIHPDAPSLDYLKTEDRQTIKANLLFRLLILLETLQSEDGNISKLYESVFVLLIPYVDEEYGERLELNKYTDLTEYGSDALIGIVDELIVSIKIIEEDINDNWEKGLIKNFNPYQSINEGIPFVVFEIEFKEALLADSFIGKIDYSALSISCKFK